MELRGLRSRLTFLHVGLLPVVRWLAGSEGVVCDKGDLLTLTVNVHQGVAESGYFASCHALVQPVGVEVQVPVIVHHHTHSVPCLYAVQVGPILLFGLGGKWRHGNLQQDCSMILFCAEWIVTFGSCFERQVLSLTLNDSKDPGQSVRNTLLQSSPLCGGSVQNKPIPTSDVLVTHKLNIVEKRISRNESRQVFGETLLTERAVYSGPPLERPLLSSCRIKNALKCPPL
jgi:hypothetical protein